MIVFQNIGYMGRLGNQMFQFSSTLGIAKRKGFEARFPIENCTVSYTNGPIDLNTGLTSAVKCDLLDCFDIPEEYFIPSHQLVINYSYNEERFEYDPNTENLPDGLVLNGYYQTEKYFLDIKEDLKNIFKFKPEFISPADYILDPIKEGKELVSIHVRRGDYTLYPDHHPTCDPSYYSKSIEEIKKISGDNIKIIIFSDDKDWCLNNMGNYIGNDFIISPIDNPYSELYMMTKCNYHVIANSSFSWWGSWLSDSKLTIAPEKWFGRMIQKNTEDVYCKNWIKI
jgi:hypothetical protein